MATYRIVDMYRKSKAVKGIHYDSLDNPILAYRVDKRHSLLFGLIHYWDYGAYNLCPEYLFPSVDKAKDAILKVDKSRRVTILYKQLMKVEDIKFKAKSILDGSWVQGDLIHKEDGKIAILRNEFNVSEVDPSTVCLFTGEKDMNGDNIYVGDIISNLETKSVIEVVWNDKMKMLDCKFLNGVKCCFDIPFGTFVARYHRIVVLRSKYDKEKQRMRIQTTLNDMLKKHNSHHTFIPDWIHDCAEWENDDILVEKVEQKNKQRMKKETFDFSEALRRMKEGKKVKRRIWNNGTTFINKKKIYVRCVSYNDIWGTDYLDVPFVGMPCIDGDILANDWEEVER